MIVLEVRAYVSKPSIGPPSFLFHASRLSELDCSINGGGTIRSKAMIVTVISPM